MKTCLLLLSLFAALNAGAETISAKRIKALRQLLPLKKITVGPDDQFQATVSPDGEFLVFTHKADLVTHLRMQNIATGQVTELLPLDADSQDANFARDGRLAFTYYKFSARGDICFIDQVNAQVTTQKDKQIHCLTRPAGEASSERSSPFWRSRDEIGYVVRDINTQNTRIVVENLHSHATSTIAQGKVWAPSMRMEGRFIVYSSVGSESGKRFLILRDLKTGQSRQLKLAVPGISGFAAISEDERFVYFSHFLDDTNQDNAIDGKDNAVIFRLPIDRVFGVAEETEIFPEPLTSVESSCSFPRPFNDRLFVTCAFESTLDIYQVPATGTVPADWDRAVLDNAYKTSRSYADRVLLLATSRYRFGNSGLAFDAELLSNHILAGDFSAAKYYLNLVAAQVPAGERKAYAILALSLEGESLKGIQPPGEITRAFQDQIHGLLAKLDKIGDEPRMHALVRGKLLALLTLAAPAQKEWERVPTNGTWRPLERYLYFQLAEAIFNTPASRAHLLRAFRSMMTAPELTAEARLYYSFQALRAIEGFHRDPKPRIAAIEGLLPGLPEDVGDLLASEVAVLHVVQEPDYQTKLPYYKKMDTLMRKATSDYFLRKAMNIRAVLNFNVFADFESIRIASTNWLRDTAASDTEFFYARDVVSTASLDQAYGYYAQKQIKLASNYFFESLSLTDDLESHAGYLRTMIEQGQRQVIDTRYSYLVSHQQVDDNFKFVKAFLMVVDSETAKPDDRSTKALDGAIALLNGMEQDRDSGVRYLFLGYSYLEKMRRTALGIEFDNATFQSAHRNLMLAYDQGRDNDRVREAALMNLGVLHQRAGNFGLSAKFFAMRKKLGFDSDEAHTRFAWLYSRSLFHSYQIDLAAKEIAEIPLPLRSPPLRERQAFYLAMSGDVKGAVTVYADLLQSGQIQGAMNEAKVNLGYGYALFKLKRGAEARVALSKSLRASESLKRIPKDETRVLDFEPLRLRLIATGLLGQIGTPAEKLQALKQRGELLKGAGEIIENWEPVVLQNHLQAAELETENEAAAELATALKLAESYAKVNGYLGNAVYRTVMDYMVHAVMNPARYKAGDKTLRTLVQKSVEAMQAQRPAPALIEYERIKLELVWSAYQVKVDHEGSAAGRVKELLTSADGQRVKSELPPKWTELGKLEAALR